MKNLNVLFVSIGFFFVFLGFGPSQQYLIPLLKIQGEQNLAFASLIILYAFFLISGIFSPKIIDKIGAKNTLIIGALTYSLYSLSVILEQNLIFYISSALLGIGAGFLWVSAGKIIAESSEPDETGRNFGFQYSLLMAGNFLGIGVGGFLFKIIPFHYLYILYAAITFLSIPFLIKIKSENQTPLPDSLKETKLDISLLFSKKLLVLFPIIFSSYFVLAQTFAAINLIVLQFFGLGLVGFFATIFWISNIVGSFAVGKISDIFKKNIILIFLAFCGLAGVLIFLNTKSAIFFGTGMILSGIFTAGIYPVCLSLLKQNMPSEEYTKAVGVFQVYSTVGVLSALISAKFFIPKISFFPGIIFLLTSIFLLFFLKRIYTKI